MCFVEMNIFPCCKNFTTALMKPFVVFYLCTQGLPGNDGRPGANGNTGLPGTPGPRGNQGTC